MRTYFDSNIYKDVFERKLYGAEIFEFGDSTDLSEDNLYEIGAGCLPPCPSPLSAKTILKIFSIPNVRIIGKIDALIGQESQALGRLEGLVHLHPNPEEVRSEISNLVSRIEKHQLTKAEIFYFMQRRSLKNASNTPWIERTRQENSEFPTPKNIQDIFEHLNLPRLLSQVMKRGLTAEEVQFYVGNHLKFPFSLSSILVHSDLALRAMRDGRFKHDRLDDARHLIAASTSDYFVTNDRGLIAVSRELGRKNTFTSDEYIAFMTST